MIRIGWLFVGLGALGCRPPAVVVDGEVPREDDVSVRAPWEGGVREELGRLVVVRDSELPRVRGAPKVLEPSFGQLVSSADGLFLRWSPAAPALPDRMVVVVDDGPVVTLFPGETQRLLETFLFPGRSLEVGDHRVVLCWMRGPRLARTEAGLAACHGVFFAVGRRQDAGTSGIVVMAPHGTYSGPTETNRIPVDVFGMGGAFEGPRHYVLIRIGGLGTSPVVRALAPGPAYALENLPSGDYTLDVLLHDADGRPVDGRWTSVVRTITINADVPDEPALTVPGVSSAL